MIGVWNNKMGVASWFIRSCTNSCTILRVFFLVFASRSLAIQLRVTCSCSCRTVLCMYARTYMMINVLDLCTIYILDINYLIILGYQTMLIISIQSVLFASNCCPLISSMIRASYLDTQSKQVFQERFLANLPAG